MDFKIYDDKGARVGTGRSFSLPRLEPLDNTTDEYLRIAKEKYGNQLEKILEKALAFGYKPEELAWFLANHSTLRPNELLTLLGSAARIGLSIQSISKCMNGPHTGKEK